MNRRGLRSLSPPGHFNLHIYTRFVCARIQISRHSDNPFFLPRLRARIFPSGGGPHLHNIARTRAGKGARGRKTDGAFIIIF